MGVDPKFVEIAEQHLDGVAKTLEIEIGETGAAMEIAVSSLPIDDETASVVGRMLGIAVDSYRLVERSAVVAEWRAGQIDRFIREGIITEAQRPLLVAEPRPCPR